MSTTPHSATDTTPRSQSAPTPTPSQTAFDIIDALIRDPALCGWCLGRRRRYHEDYDEFREETLKHKRSVLPVIRPSSDSDPSTFQDVVPPKTDSRGQVIDPARAMSICQCGEVDVDLDKARPMYAIQDAARHICEHAADDSDVLEADFDIDPERALTLVEKMRTRPQFATQDRYVLAAAIDFGRGVLRP